MILRYAHLSRHPAVFHAMTGLTVAAFDDLITDLLPACVTANQQRLTRPNRRRAIGGGRHADLCWTNQVLLTVVWLRTYPTNEVLAYLIGVSDSTISRVLARMVPLLEAAGKDTMRLPDPGRKRRRQLDDLLRDTPALAVVIDTFEQRVQRCKDRDVADTAGSGIWRMLGLTNCTPKALARRRAANRAAKIVRLRISPSIGRSRGGGSWSNTVLDACAGINA